MIPKLKQVVVTTFSCVGCYFLNGEKRCSRPEEYATCLVKTKLAKCTTVIFVEDKSTEGKKS